jgi:hypothetical protein
MKKFMLLYHGPATRPGASHEGWPEWFQRAGDKLVDMGSPMANGFVVHSDGAPSGGAASLNGYSIVQVGDRGEALDLAKDHPFLALGAEYTIEIFEVPKK